MDIEPNEDIEPNLAKGETRLKPGVVCFHLPRLKPGANSPPIEMDFRKEMQTLVA